MSGMEDGIVDALYSFSRLLNGGYYWCPPLKDGRLTIARASPRLSAVSPSLKR
jgi:putative iron-dependent peroxidase